MFPLKAWYVACTPDEIAAGPLGRRICGQSMVFYRGEGGAVVALEDFCPHRGAPLSLGTVQNGQLVCGYHGLVMGAEGKPVAMPGQRVHRFPCVKRFAAVERHGFIWVWPGDAQDADLSALPHLEWAQNPDWAYGGGLYHIQADYRLMIDNLMDLSHETYVHSNSIGQKEIDETPAHTEVQGQEVVTRRFMDGVMAPPFWRANLRGAHLPDDQPVDRWQVCRFSLPSHVMIEVGVALAGHGGYHAPDDKKVYSIVVDFITPETEHSHWYFWGMARKFNVKDEALTTLIRENQAKVFAEDLTMLEAQQRSLLERPERRLLMLNIDAGGVQSRRLIERVVEAERAQAPASASV